MVLAHSVTSRWGRAVGGLYRPHLIWAIALAGMLAVSGGCISIKASLATDSGPSRTGWSTLDTQLVHVGERVGFSVVLVRSMRSKAPISPLGVADYCIASVGTDMIEADLDDDGHYRFAYDIVGRRSGEVIPVSAVLYRQRGRRDIMKVGGTWVQGDDPYDQTDHVVARASLRLIVYSSQLDLPVEHPQLDLEMAAGRMEIRKSDGLTTDIYYQRGGNRGFLYTDPDEKGAYHVTYQPRADELNKCGTTRIRFSTYDTAGNPHVTDALINTP